MWMLTYICYDYHHHKLFLLEFQTVLDRGSIYSLCSQDSLTLIVLASLHM